MNELNIIILAAGMGTRLHPYTENRPKCLVELDGKSLLQHQLEIVRAYAEAKITIVGGYHSEMLESFADCLVRNERYDSTNMVYSLFCAEQHFSDSVIISYGDIVYSKHILEALAASTADISVVTDSNWHTYWQQRFDNVLDDAETLKVNSHGDIIEIGAIPTQIGEIEGQYIGLIKLSSEGIRQLTSTYDSLKRTSEYRGRSAEKLYVTDLLQAAIDMGFSVKSVPVSSPWVEVDTVSDLQSDTTHRRLAQIRDEMAGNMK